MQIHSCHKDAWQLFKNYHYLNGYLTGTSQNYLAKVDGRPCAFLGVINFPHPKVKNIRKTHRLVVLPEFQGLGIGRILTDEIASHYLKQGFRYRETTSHPARIMSHKKNPNWICVESGRMHARGSTSGIGVGGDSRKRLITTWEFTGGKKDG